MTEWQLLEHLFNQGLDRDKSGREAILAKLSTQQAHLKEELIALWSEASDDREETFDLLPGLTFGLLARQHTAPEHPVFIGEFQIEELLARGINSSVYKAKQTGAMQRNVALKVLHRTLSDQDHRRRFHAEGQALAMLAHPHIATAFEAGLTSEGAPYFAMEFIDGQPITGWCVSHRLSLDDRLLLFLDICEGVAHAHQRGIVHRDLKPSNILVTNQGQQATPKIIDFGVAKFQNDDIPAPYLTREGMIIGTPAYMSPEQASGRVNAVDTRTDVYALGILLHEMLTGSTPLGEDLARAGSIRAACTMIEQHEATRPSRKVCPDHPQTFPHMEMDQLIHYLSGEMDWMLLKALARDPADRYQSVSEFAEDVRRFRNGYPIMAAPPDGWYQLKKLLLRKRQWVLTGGLVAATFFLGFLGTFFGFLKATEAKDQAREALAQSRQHQAKLEAVRDFNRGIFANVGPYGMGRDVKGRRLLDFAAKEVAHQYRGKPDLEAATRTELGLAYKELGLLDQADEQLKTAQAIYSGVQNIEDGLRGRNGLAFIAYLRGDFQAAEGGFTSVQKATLPGSDPWIAAGSSLAQVLSDANRLDEAKALFEEVLQGPWLENPSRRDQLARIRENYGLLLHRLGKPTEANRLFSENLSYFQTRYGESHPLTQTSRHNLARTLENTQPQRALAEYETVLAKRKAILGPQHIETLRTLHAVAVVAGNQGQLDRALELLTPFKSQLKTRPKHLVYLELTHSLGHFLMVDGQTDLAGEVLKKTLAYRRAMLGEQHPDTLISAVTLAENYFKENQPILARQSLEAVLRITQKTMGKDHPVHLSYQRLLDHWSKQ